MSLITMSFWMLLVGVQGPTPDFFIPLKHTPQTTMSYVDLNLVFDHRRPPAHPLDAALMSGGPGFLH